MAIKTRKVGIIGAGNVGSHLGLQLAVQGLADEVVFYDVNNDKAMGESLDLMMRSATSRIISKRMQVRSMT